MLNDDVLLHILSHLDDKLIQDLVAIYGSLPTPKGVYSNTLFWRERAQKSSGKILKERDYNFDWRTVYYTLFNPIKPLPKDIPNIYWILQYYRECSDLIHILTEIGHRSNMPWLGNYPLELAITNNNLEVVEILLSCSDANPSVNNNCPLILAIGHGNPKIVKLLLLDSRVDPSIDENIAIFLASHSKHHNQECYVEIIEMLLKDARVDPSDRNNRAFWHAVKEGFQEIVQALIRDSRVKKCYLDYCGYRVGLLVKNA